MRSITRKQLKVLQSERLEPVELVDLLVAGASTGSTLRLTNAGEQVTFGGNLYYPINMGRSEIRSVLEAEAGNQPSITLTVSNVDGQMAALLNRVELGGAAVEIWQHDRRLLARHADTAVRDALPLWRGEVRDPVLDGSTLLVQVVDVVTVLDRTSIPRRVFGADCGVAYGSAACGASLASPATILTTAQGGSTRKIVRLPTSILTTAGNPSDPDKFWANGYLTFAEGDNAVQSRPIQRVVNKGSSVWFFVRDEFLADPATGDDVYVRRGCPKTLEACEERQGHVLNHRGYPDVPKEIKFSALRGFDGAPAH
jgi:hypothetical protein